MARAITPPPQKTRATPSGAKPAPQAAKNLSRHDAPPRAWLLPLEIRAAGEFVALLPAWPLLTRAPRGDQHPVMVFPGLSANDLSTVPLRRYLQSLNYCPTGWQQGFNWGPRPGVLEQAKENLSRTFAKTGRKVSLIGWSLGGIYARELTKELPHMVRGVITLGTPFAGTHQSTSVWRIYERFSGRSVEAETSKYDLPTAPPVPSSSIYSRSDGVVAWQGSVQSPDSATHPTENIEVLASHAGLGFNPSAWWAVANRLAQPEGQWTPFAQQDRGRLQGLIYPDPQRKA